MLYRSYLFDALTGQLGAPIDLASINWDISVADSALSTTRNHDVGKASATGISVPWSAVPGATMAERRRMISPLRTGVMVFSLTDDDLEQERMGTPFIGGFIGLRHDNAHGTSFDLLSPLGLLEHRYMVREGKYGTGANHTSPDTIALKNLSMRAIACAIGEQCTGMKPAGHLPIDWQYTGEKGTHARTYEAWDVQNLSGAHLLGLLSNVSDGPDMQFRPTVSIDGRYVGWRFEAGSDGALYLGETIVHSLSYHPTGGMLQDLQVDRIAPAQRVYASGSGTDKAQTTVLCEDLTMCQLDIAPFPLYELTYADSDTEKATLLKAHAQAVLESNRIPLMQLKASVNISQRDQSGYPRMPLGSFWPGERFDLDIRDYAPLPDGVYRTRLMQMSGDGGDTVHLTFDVMEDTGIW